MINVENNFLEIDHFNKLVAEVNDTNFPWYFNRKNKFFYHDLVRVDKEKDSVDQSAYINLLRPFVKKLDFKKINSAQFVLSNKTNNIIEYETVNFKKNNNSLVSYFFLDSSDGYIQLVNHTRVNYVENKILTLSKEYPHYGSTQTKIDYNIFLIIDYEQNH